MEYVELCGKEILGNERCLWVLDFLSLLIDIKRNGG